MAELLETPELLAHLTDEEAGWGDAGEIWTEALGLLCGNLA